MHVPWIESDFFLFMSGNISIWIADPAVAAAARNMVI
jgi:hypothetical protein